MRVLCYVCLIGPFQIHSVLQWNQDLYPYNVELKKKKETLISQKGNDFSDFGWQTVHSDDFVLVKNTT